MKHKSVKKITSLLLSGALLAMGTAGIMPAMHASAATADPSYVTDNAAKLRYYYEIIPGTNNCKLERITDLNGTWSLTTKTAITIPSTITVKNGNTSSTYTVTELGGFQNQAVIHSNNPDHTRVATLTIPNTVKRINRQAFIDYEVPALTTLKINVGALNYCAPDAFGRNCNLTSIKIYNPSSNAYNINTNTKSSFENYYGALLTTTYKACNGDLFKLNNSSLANKLTFLGAVSTSPYYKQVAYEYAQKIAQDNGFTATNISVQKKLEMIYNYMKTNVRYSYILDTENERTTAFGASPLGVLAFHSGICEGIAYGFEYLCRASGINVTNSASTSSVLDVSLPAHLANAFRFSSNQGYYMIDCTTSSFMTTMGYETAGFSDAYVNDKNTLNHNRSTIPFSYSNLNSANFCEGNSYFKIETQINDSMDVEIYDKNNPNCKFTKFIAKPKNVIGQSYKPEQFAGTSEYNPNYNPPTEFPQYVSSYVYFGIKVGGVVINTTSGSSQNITVNGHTYKVQFQTRNYAQTGVAPRSAYSDYYYLSITRI